VFGRKWSVYILPLQAWCRKLPDLSNRRCLLACLRNSILRDLPGSPQKTRLEQSRETRRPACKQRNSRARARRRIASYSLPHSCCLLHTPSVPGYRTRGLIKSRCSCRHCVCAAVADANSFTTAKVKLCTISTPELYEHTRSGAFQVGTSSLSRARDRATAHVKSRFTDTMSQQHLPPFPFGGSVPFQPTQHQTNNNNMSATNPAVPTAIPQMQQAAFMQNAQLPGLDMATVLQGITPEQLAYIGQLYQSGIIPLPPAQALPTAQPLATNVQAQPAVQQNGMAESIERQEQDSMAIDKEINDLEDGEVSPQREPEFLHPPPTGPRKRSGSIHMRPGHDNADKRAKRQPSPPRQSQGYDRRRPEPRTGKTRTRSTLGNSN
jgi:hypothetical protein